MKNINITEEKDVKISLNEEIENFLKERGAIKAGFATRKIMAKKQKNVLLILTDQHQAK